MNMFFRKYYHYVPPCPRCGSHKTGRYVNVLMPNYGTEKIIAKCLKGGELIKITGDLSLPENNVYCEDCGAEWSTNIDTFLINKKQLEMQIKLRGITQKIYKDMKNYKKIKKKTDAKTKREEKKRKKEEKRKRRHGG